MNKLQRFNRSALKRWRRIQPAIVIVLTTGFILSYGWLAVCYILTLYPAVK